MFRDICSNTLATMLLIFYLLILFRIKDLKMQKKLLLLSKIKVYLQLGLQDFAGAVSFCTKVLGLLM